MYVPDNEFGGKIDSIAMNVIRTILSVQAEVGDKSTEEAIRCRIAGVVDMADAIKEEIGNND